MARLSFGKRVQFFTDLGLYAGFMTNAMRVYSNTNYGSFESSTTIQTITANTLVNDVRKVDGGLVTGLGLSVPIWKTISFSFEARNNMGFANLNNNSAIYQNKFFNNSTVFMIGLSALMGKPLKSGQLRYENPK